MPHRASASSINSTNPGRMTSTTTTSGLFSNRPGVALSSPSSSSQPARNFSSLPIPEAYPEVDSRNKIDGFLFDNQKNLGNRHSMMAGNYNSSSKQLTQYYEEQFQYKDNATSNAKERVQRESPVVAELRTNVIIKDEFTLVTDLSFHLAARYARPDSAIMVKVDHSSCLALGGTFDPCYILEITAVPSQMGPTMNKRNAALIQSFMADILSVPPERGIVKFSPIPEENFAINGTTMLGEAERQEKQQSGGSESAVRRVISSGRKSIPSFKKSSSKLNAEAKTTDLKPIESNSSDAAFNAQERKGSVQSVAATSPAGVFELPAVNMDKARPSTSHSTSGSGESNPLRMNGISDLELSVRNSKAANGRPRTVSGGTSSTSIQDRIYRQAYAQGAPAPTIKRQFNSFLTVDPASGLPKSLNTRPTSSGKGSSKPASIDVLVSPFSAKPIEASIPEKPSQEVVSGGKDEPTANTAKRRSTINADKTTALPQPPAKGLMPPPVPVEAETKSMRSFRLGKRKSFLAAFRRSSTQAQ